MALTLEIRSESTEKYLYRRDVLQRIADRVWDGEGLTGDGELSVLFCDDAAIQELNRTYRKKDMPTDVLSFEQEGSCGDVRILGDIVISLETVSSRFPGDAVAMREEVKLLFCHGLLHLVGYDHGNAKTQKAMALKQAAYLGIPIEHAWPAAV